jgi:hypothetical protein
MSAVFRTPEANFSDLKDFTFAPHWHSWEGLRVHYLDEGLRLGIPSLATRKCSRA